MRWATASLTAAVTLALSPAPAQAAPHIAGCPVFPKSNPWNQRVDRLPVLRELRRDRRSIGLGDTMHADFGSGCGTGRRSGSRS